MDCLYKLRSTILGHSMDVRGVAAGCNADGQIYIVSASRDKTSKVWLPNPDDGGFHQVQVCEGHTNFVSYVTTVPPSQQYPSGLILTGGNDHTILAFEFGKKDPIFRLVGHKGTVCAIATTSGGLIVSGSWDQTSKVWAEQGNIATLSGHDAAVWAVASIPNSDSKILTASADKTIRYWIDFKCEKIFRGHTDCVRTLAIKSQDVFISGSNDATIRIWNISSAEAIQVLFGHANFIYSIAILGDSETIISVGEDRTLRVWREAKCSQTIFLPATSVWCVCPYNNTDIVVGSSDGTVRVFTNNPNNMAPPEKIMEFEEEVSKSTIAAQQELGGMKITELPGPEALLREGKSDGETKMVRSGEKVECYSWSAAEKKWNKVGDVVGASGATQSTSGKVLYEGKEYDYVFTVEFENQKNLKLPYNITEDPWFAAQRFIDKNFLSQYFLDQVANFIITNAKGMELGTSQPTQYQDPFTGGNRYIPGSNNAGNTGGNASGLDPFTGSGAYTTSKPAPTKFPVKSFLKFQAQPNQDSLMKKLHSFVSELGSNCHEVSNEDINTLTAMISSSQWSDEVRFILEKFFKWPSEYLFPILDLLRVGSLQESFLLNFNKSFPVVQSLAPMMISSSSAPTQMLILRILCNSFGVLTSDLMAEKDTLVSLVLNNLKKEKTNQVAAASLILNYSIIASGLDENQREWNTAENKTSILMSALSMMDRINEEEGMFRILVALGNLLCDDTQLKSLFKDMDGEQRCLQAKKADFGAKVKECASEIIQVL